MGLFHTLMSVAKARMLGRLMTRGLGGRMGTAMMIAYLGKKAYDYAQSRRRGRVSY